MVIDYKNEPPLIQAVLTNNLKEVKELLKKIDNINLKNDIEKHSALHVAAHCKYNRRGGLLPTKQIVTNSSDDVEIVEGEKVDEELAMENRLSEKKDDRNLEICRALCKAGARVNFKDGYNGLTALQHACRNNNYLIVKLLLRFQADVNCQDKNWQTPLHISCIYDSFESANALVLSKKIYNIDIADRQGRSALAYAAFNGNVQLVKLLIENKADCNIKDKHERRPLHWASYMGYTEVVKILHENGADINCRDKDMFTPLLVVCASGKSEELIDLLIDLGADTQATTTNGSSIFHMACLNGHDHLIRHLLDKHKLEMRLNARGYHPLHYAAGCKRGSFCVEMLVAAAQTTAVDNDICNQASSFDGRTPLHIAASHGLTTNAQILISNGSNVNAVDKENNTPLHLAASNGHNSMMEFLFESGANIYICGSNNMLPYAMATLNGHSDWYKTICQAIPNLELRREYFNSVDNKNRTFMHLAAILGNFECLNFLIKTGCDPNAKDKTMNSPLHFACAGCHLKCVQLLIASGAKLNELNESIIEKASASYSEEPSWLGKGCTPLMLACAYDQKGFVVRELVLNANVKVNVTDRNGYNTLHYAALQGNRNVFEIAYYGNQEGLEVLIRNNFELELKDFQGRTALDLACFEGELSCVRSLVRAGADCRSQDFVDQRTPVHAAAYNNQVECLKALECQSNRMGRLGDLRDRHGRTPLMYAVEKGHTGVFDVLINRLGADVFAGDNKKRTALHRAACLGHEECCNHLLTVNTSTILQRDENGFLPFHYAIMSGQANMAGVLFENHHEHAESREDKFLYDYFGFSVFHLACFHGHVECVDLICHLLTNSSRTQPKYLSEIFTSSVDHATKFSPLHCACFMRHKAVVSYLLDKFGRDIVNEAVDDAGNTALHVCAARNAYECAALMLDDEPDGRSSWRATPLTVIDHVNRRGQTALMLAAKKNSFNVLELLLKRRPRQINNNKQKQTSNKQTAAALNSAIDIKPKAVTARLDLFDLEGNSALHLALINKNENCALFILDELTEDSELINAQNKNGDTALHIAASNGFITSVEMLINKRADVWIKNMNGKTPLLSCARDNQVAECLDLMVSRVIAFVAVSSTSGAATTTTSSMAVAAAAAAINNQTYTPLKHAINRSASNTPKNIKILESRHHHHQTNNLDDSTTSLIVTPLLGIMNYDAMALSNSSLNNLNSTLISNETDVNENDQITEENENGLDQEEKGTNSSLNADAEFF